jgi:hypothetical protein
MKSHSYEITISELIRQAGILLAPLAVFSLGMHFGAATSLLPQPLPAHDTDRTILFHQAEASRQPDGANLLLVGDSSCLMNVSALELSAALDGIDALNLGTLSYLGLESFGLIVEQFLEANPDQVRAVVLLMHPEALRRPAGTEYHTEALERFYIGADFCGPALPPILCGLGVEIFRGRILSRMLPQPLPGAYGRSYGFTHDLWSYLSEHRGSALDPNHYAASSLTVPAEYRLTPRLEAASREFRAVLPPGVRLIIGITPVPESLAGRDFDTVQREMLETWRGWMRADVALSELPAVWPDALFASSTHLNERGVKRYTELLAGALSGAEN